MGSGCYRFKFLEEIRLHWLFHMGFEEIRFLKWHDVINSNYWFLAILREFSGLLLSMLILFFLKLNRILTKIDVSCVETRVLDPLPLSHQLFFSIPFFIWNNNFLFLAKYSLLIFDIVLHYQLNAFKTPKMV